MTDSVFADWRSKSYPFTFHGEIVVDTLVGGVPRNPNVIKGWIESKLKDSQQQRIRDLVAETVATTGVTSEQAVEEISQTKHLNGFKVDPEHGLFYEGRQLKAGLKEAVSIAVSAGKLEMTKWGSTRKWLTNYFPEHVFVVEERLYLGVSEPTGVLQQFVHTHNGSSIQYQEYVTDAKLTFTIVTDHDFTDQDWAMIWTTGEMNGLGASRSQGYGTYQVTKWEKTVDEKALAELKKRLTAKAATTRRKSEPVEEAAE